MLSAILAGIGVTAVLTVSFTIFSMITDNTQDKKQTLSNNKKKNNDVESPEEEKNRSIEMIQGIPTPLPGKKDLEPINMPINIEDTPKKIMGKGNRK